MAEIYTEIIVIRKYKFCDEIWEIIKEYMGLYGIDLRLPDIMNKITGSALYQYNEYIFGYDKITKSGSQRKLFYNNLKYMIGENRKSSMDKLIKRYNDSLFKIPKDLEIGEIVLFYNFYEFEADSEIGFVGNINEKSFTIRIYENNKFSHYRIIKKNSGYLRMKEASREQLKYFKKFKTNKMI